MKRPVSPMQARDQAIAAALKAGKPIPHDAEVYRTPVYLVTTPEGAFFVRPVSVALWLTWDEARKLVAPEPEGTRWHSNACVHWECYAYGILVPAIEALGQGYRSCQDD